MSRISRQATRGNNRPVLPAWGWLGIGGVLGAALSALVLVRGWTPILRHHELPQPNPDATVAPAADGGIEAATAPPKKFDFYQALPEMEVVIPDAELTAKARAERQAASQPAAGASPVAPAQSAGRYVLQVGSYPDPKSADEAKAKLALLGYVARVEPVTVNGKTWNRVRLGPYPSATDLEAAKQSLATNGVHAIALKETPPQ